MPTGKSKVGWPSSYGHVHAPTLMNQMGQGMAQNPSMLQNQQGMANNAYNQNAAAFQHAAAQQALLRQYQQHIKLKEFRINGVDMDLDEFLDALYPEDCAERTYLALKLTKGNDDAV